ncbi:hypothetical protein [Adlercreutzia sp. ZJ473]|uniref:hypothetical protein n=1 Tax=Adlercreutzia sp. ZJ473 TaxID=2722822 RepID=UPI0015548539|nr:hypothetical protein [Adlercreutzia sp. ZJ473]
MAGQDDIFNDNDQGQSGDDSLFGTDSRDNDASPIQVVNPYGGVEEPVVSADDAPQVAQPANPYASVQPAAAEPAAGAYAAAGPAAAGAAQAQAQPAGNPYQQTYGGAAGPAAAQGAANPYGAPASGAPGAAGIPGAPGASGAPGAAGANPYGAPQPAAGQPYQPYQQPAGAVPPYGQPPAGPQPYGQPYPGAAAPASAGKATGALVCGILAILLASSVVPSIILGIVAIVLAGSYLKSGGTAGTAKAGRICGVLGIVFSVIAVVSYFAFFGMAVSQMAADEIGSGSGLVSSSEASSDDVAGSDYTEDEKAAIDLVSAELEKIKTGDEAMLASIAAIVQEDFVEGTGLTMAQCGIDPMEYARAMTQGFDYEVSMYVVDRSSEGFVAFDVTCRDVFDVLNRFNALLSDFKASGEASSMTQEQGYARIGELFMQAVNEADMEQDGYFSVDVEYKNGKWVMDQDEWEDELDYFFGLY